MASTVPAMNEQGLADIVDVIRRRRTNLRVDPDRAVPDALIEQLCEAATLAPNHKLTEPWRFAALRGTARSTLGEVVAHELEARGVTDGERLAKTKRKYLRAPVVLVVGCAPDSDPVRHAENRDAVAAGVQNTLLAATAAGLASYWATGVAARSDAVRELCGFETGTEVVALVYLGWPVAEAPDRGRTRPVINWIGGDMDTGPNPSR